MQQEENEQLDGEDNARRIEILDALGITLSGKRQDAIDARANSGIEGIWTEDEEFYMGIDDANRDELSGSIDKPPTAGQPVRPSGADGAALKSTVFPNITQPYVDAAAARIGDMLLPTDDRNFSLEPTPIPELSGLEDALSSTPNAPPPVPVPSGPAAFPPPLSQQSPAGGAPGLLAAQPAAAAPANPAPNPLSAQPQAPPAPPQAPPRMIKLADGTEMPEEELRKKIAETKAEARRRTDKAQDRIDDWLTECDYIGKVRTAFDDCAKVGTGVIKGPCPVKRQRTTWSSDPNGGAMLTTTVEINPATTHISYWNLFPDPACGESIHNGSYIWEKDTLTPKKIEALKGLPGYIDEQIDLCLDEGPAAYVGGGKQLPDVKNKRTRSFEIWYFHGQIDSEELEAAGCVCDGSKKKHDVLITMVNDRVIRAALNPLDTGEFPYDVIRWKRRKNSWTGVGVSRQMRTPQRMVVAATRNMMDNAGLGAGPMLILGRGISPQDGIWEIRPRKIWVRDQESDDRPVDQDMKAIVIPMLQKELEAIIMLGMKMAEDCTGMPMLLQGQQGQAPDTVGGMQILNNNGTSVLRRVARHFDNDLTLPHVDRYYDWLMYYGEDLDEKGDLFVQARGSSALVERDAQSMELTQIVGMTLNPAFGKNPKKAMNEYLKSRRFDPETFNYTEEEQAKLDATPPPAPPQLEVAKIRAAVDEKKLASTEKTTAQKLQVEMEKVQNDTDRDLTYVEAETARTQSEHEGRMKELAVKRELALLLYANTRQITLDQVKASLTETALELRTQKELAAASNAMAAKEVAHAAIEPPGRAPNGQAFQK